MLQQHGAKAFGERRNNVMFFEQEFKYYSVVSTFLQKAITVSANEFFEKT
jgi:hypothetical protein